MIELYKPALEDLWFRERFMGDEATMSYNHAWGGTIPFPESRWGPWYDHWVAHPQGMRFYRYLLDRDAGAFVGEAAFHFDPDRQLWLADVIVPAEYRGRGYGRQGLELLCRAAAARGIEALYDDIAADNPGIAMFLKAGFTEEYRTREIIMLKKELKTFR